MGKILSAAGNDNGNGNDNANNIISAIKDIKLCIPIVTLSARVNQKLSKLCSKGSERSVYWNEHKTKIGNKYTKNEIVIFSNQILLETIDPLFYFIQIKITILKDLKFKDITYQKELLIIIMSSSMEKTFMTNPLILI